MPTKVMQPWFIAGLCVLAATTAHAQTTRRHLVTDALGTRVVRENTTATFPGLPPTGPRENPPVELWRVTDPIAIVERVSVSGVADEVWASFNLNSERLGYFRISGTGVPVYEFNVQSSNPRLVAGVSAEDASLCLLLTEDSTGIKVRAFTGPGGNTPAWTYSFPPNITFSSKRNIDVSDDGSIGIAAAIDQGTNETQLVVFDTATGNLLNRATLAARLFGVELSRDGSRAVLTDGGTAHVVDIPTLNTLTTLTASGAGGWQRISGDGTTVAAGGFNCLVAREISPGIWTTLVSFSAPTSWFGNGMALSDDGSTFFAVSHNYATGYLELTYRVFDTATGAMTAQTSTQGAGQFQDSVRVAHASADGSILACASWGTQNNVHPEVQVFDRNLNRIAGIDSNGSAFDMSMSRDGRYIASGTKSVHANTFGNGGEVIVIDLGPSCYPDCDGNGTLDIFDFLCFQNLFVAGDPYACQCDTNPVPVCDIFDFLCFQNAFVAGCP